jgi:hypothetical protein
VFVWEEQREELRRGNGSARTLTLPMAVTVAALALSVRRAISPKYEEGYKRATSTSPCSFFCVTLVSPYARFKMVQK